MSQRRGRADQEIEWHFFAFPVFFAFALGALFATILAPFLFPVIFVLSLFGVSFGTAHMISHSWRRRGLRKRRMSEEEEERERRALAARAARETAEAGESTSLRRRRRRRRPQ